MSSLEVPYLDVKLPFDDDEEIKKYAKEIIIQLNPKWVSKNISFKVNFSMFALIFLDYCSHFFCGNYGLNDFHKHHTLNMQCVL